MRKGIVVWIVFLVCTTVSMAQQNNEIQWAWSNTYGNGNANSIANHLEVDDSSNMYIAGVFRGELIVQTDTIYGNPNEDRVFVAKFDSLGTLQWIRKIDWGYYVNQIRLDSDNDLRVLCNAGVMIVYNGMNGVPITYYGVPNSISDSNSATPFGVVIDFKLDAADNVYFLSRFEDMNTFETSSYVAVFASPNDTISGLIWEDYINIGFMGPAGPGGLALDDGNNVYVTGTTDFAVLSLVGVDVVSTPQPGVELFAVKYNTQGDAIWLTTDEMGFAEVMATEVNTVDSSLYISGYTVIDEVFFGDTLLLDSTNQQQIYLMKFDLEGNNEWAKAFPLETKSLKNFVGASWGAMGTDIQLSDSGYVYLKGSFTGSIIFYNDTLVEDTSSVIVGSISDDAFIAKLDQNGNPIWGKYAGNQGGQGLETGDFYVDAAQDVLYLVGYWAAPNNLFKMATPTNSVKNIFLGKEGEPSSVSVEEISAEGITLLVYPNPSTGVYHVSKPPNTGSFEYSVIDIQGNLVLSGALIKNMESIDLTDMSNGMYFLKTELGSMKMLKQ
ncbi:MAG: hypothetical protein ACJA1C_001842 [Crocinitomicaceae bacterium]|jgi:hypothetical protein